MANFRPNSSKQRLDQKCKECGCNCDSCVDVNSIHLHQEIEDLKDRLTEKDRQIISMESQILSHAKQYPDGEMQALRKNLYFCQDKFERLLESYRKLQKVNQGLEDKLLRIADTFENEKIDLTHRVTELTCKLDQTESDFAELQRETARYKNDCNLAINLLQCKPSQFVSPKLDSLPDDVQDRAQHYMNLRRPPHNDNNVNHNNKFGGKLIRVPISTFPPTAVVYSLNEEDEALRQDEVDNKPTSNYVSAAIMAKILEEREKERYNESRCVNCYNKDQRNLLATQTKSQLSIDIDESRQTNSSQTIPNFRPISMDNFIRKDPRPNSETIINI